MLKRLIKIVGLSAAALTLFLWSRPGNVGAQSDVRLCPADRPCIKQLYQDGATLVIGWDGMGNYDHYNFRWSRPGKAETQSEVRGGGGGSFRINNVNPDTRYTVKVQGCKSSFLGRSNCTPWYEDSIVTRTQLHHGPDTCKNGFVWREASPSDHVCVTPQTRSQTANDNQLAASRRSPNGGPWGPATCKQGYVWREAFPSDLVCVTPQTRAQAAEDNRLAPGRRVQ